MQPISSVRSVSAARAYELVQAREARLLDLRTEAERRRYGWPPGAPHVSLARHIAAPSGPDVIYLCQHVNRSKLTARNGTAEIRDGWSGWQKAGLPIERR